jgi:hypothetical protein
MPVTVDGTRLGTARIGVSVPARDQHEADQRWAANQVLWLTALLCLLAVIAAGVAGWPMIAHARKKDEAEARRDHLDKVGKLASGLVPEIRNSINAMRMQIAVMRSRLKRLQGEEAEAVSALDAMLLQHTNALHAHAMDIASHQRAAHNLASVKTNRKLAEQHAQQRELHEKIAVRHKGAMAQIGLFADAFAETVRARDNSR